MLPRPLRNSGKQNWRNGGKRSEIIANRFSHNGQDWKRRKSEVTRCGLSENRGKKIWLVCGASLVYRLCFLNECTVCICSQCLMQKAATAEFGATSKNLFAICAGF